MIFLELVPHSAMCVLPKKWSERSGSFFLYSNDLRIAVMGQNVKNVQHVYQSHWP